MPKGTKGSSLGDEPCQTEMKPKLYIRGGVLLQLGASTYDGGNWAEATQLFTELATAPELADFLTLPAYESIIKKDRVQARM